LQLFALSVFPFLIIDHIGSIGLKLNKALP
jgi:hypothetical protein